MCRGGNRDTFLLIDDECRRKMEEKDPKYHSLGHDRDFTNLNMGGVFGSMPIIPEYT